MSISAVSPPVSGAVNPAEMMTLEEAAGTDGKLTAGEFQTWFDSATAALPAGVLPADFDPAAFQSDVIAAFNSGAPAGGLPIPGMPGLDGLMGADGAAPPTGSCGC